MLGPLIPATLRQQLDVLILNVFNRRMPESLEDELINAPPLEQVLAETQVNRTKTVLPNLTAPGITPVYLDTALGEIKLKTRVRLHANPDAPVIIYHHGLAEVPFDSTWQRLFPRDMPFAAHMVAVQAPFHDNPISCINTGFSSLHHIYQMFAGSMRMMELMQTEFEQNGAPYTVISGLSWGGITSFLYEGLFQRARAVIPMFSSPNLAQVMADVADMFDRPLPVPREELDRVLDFTPYFDRCDKERFFPVLGEHDMFFRKDAHHPLLTDDTVMMTSAHVGATAINRVRLQEHIRTVLAWAQDNPLPTP